MATNKVQGDGRVIQVTAGADYDSGEIILIGDQGLVGVCVHDIASGAAGSVQIAGGIVLEAGVKGSTVTSGAVVDAAIAIGDKLYHLAANSGYECDANSASGTVCGYSLEAVASGATATVSMLLTAGTRLAG